VSFTTCLLGDQPTFNIALAERRDKAGADDKPPHLSVSAGASQGKTQQKACDLSICTMSGRTPWEYLGHRSDRSRILDSAFVVSVNLENRPAIVKYGSAPALRMNAF
jgi:hypothetical protein